MSAVSGVQLIRRERIDFARTLFEPNLNNSSNTSIEILVPYFFGSQNEGRLQIKGREDESYDLSTRNNK